MATAILVPDPEFTWDANRAATLRAALIAADPDVEPPAVPNEE